MSKKRENNIVSRDQNLKKIIQDSYNSIQFTGKGAVSKSIEESLKQENQKLLISIHKIKRKRNQLISDLVLAGAVTAAAVACIVILQLNQIYDVPEVSQIGLVKSEKLILAGEQPFALIQLASGREWEIE